MSEPTFKTKRPDLWKPLMPRIMARVDQDHDTGCWLVRNPSKRDGYARIIYQGRHWLAHRAVYTEIVGPIPQHLELDHHCENRNCVNPLHVEPVSPQVNTARGNSWAGINQRKTHCIRGHEFTPENTRVGPRSMGRPGFQRWCKECSRQTELRDRAKKVRADCTECDWFGKRVADSKAPCPQCNSTVELRPMLRRVS